MCVYVHTRHTKVTATPIQIWQWVNYVTVNTVVEDMRPSFPRKHPYLIEARHKMTANVLIYLFFYIFNN